MIVCDNARQTLPLPRFLCFLERLGSGMSQGPHILTAPCPPHIADDLFPTRSPDLVFDCCSQSCHEYSQIHPQQQVICIRAQPVRICEAPDRRVASSSLYARPLHRMWFGNPGNEKGDASWTNTNWLKSRFHFSFAEYRSARNSNFGVLRVMNDDLVQPHRGFGTHPHQNMEICTYIVQGKLTHQDSIGTKESLGRGSM